jgi:hypothetical protein
VRSREGAPRKLREVNEKLIEPTAKRFSLNSGEVRMLPIPVAESAGEQGP